jgi:hypothetical protein
LVVVDNFRTKAVIEIVSNFEGKEATIANVVEFKKAPSKQLPQWQSGENRFIGDLLLNAFEHSQLPRLKIFGLSKADIIMYLPESVFGLNETWDALHARWKSEKTSSNFKDWLRTKHGARISTPKIASAAKHLTEPHVDLLNLLEIVRSY